MPKKQVDNKVEDRKEEVKKSEQPKQLLFSQEEMDKIFDPKLVQSLFT